MKHVFYCYKKLILFMLLLGTIGFGWRASSSVLQVEASTPAKLTTNAGSGQLYREWWSDIEGKTIQSLTSQVNFPENPADFDFLTSFETPSNWKENYGTRLRGYLYPPVDGNYIFWIASDDNSELWLSDDKNPANVSRIATVPQQTNAREWNKFPTQQSLEISLEAGKVYYIEALMKESTEADNLAVAWQIPGQSIAVIDGEYLSPFTSRLSNVGLEGTATQSSTRSSPINYEAKNAIDNNTDGNSANNSISHTNQDFQAWWEVDLGESFYLDMVRLWNRTDCCAERLSDFYLFISEMPFNSQDLNTTINQGGVRAFFFNGQASQSENITTRTQGRYVRIQLTTANFLQLAEVQLWGTAVQANGCGPLFQEGENGLFSGTFEVGSDPLASNGFYTHVPEDSPTEFYGGLSENFMTYCMFVGTPGIYQFKSQIYAENGGSNSFYVTINDLPVDGFRWDIEPISGIYAVDYISVSGGADPYQLPLDTGQHLIKIYQREDGARLDWLEFELVNARPTVQNPGNQSHTIGETITLQINALDPENDPLLFDASGLPDGLTLDAQSGLIEGSLSAQGVFDVTVTVDDGISGPTAISFNWTVNALPNNPPTITSPGDQINTVGDSVSLQIEAEDVDNDALTYEAEGLPTGLTINESSGLITGNVTAVQINEVTITVQDGNGGLDNVTFEWQVNDVPNIPPEVVNPGPQSGKVNDGVSLFITATDQNDDTLTYSAAGLPNGLSINMASGEIAGTLTAVGSFQVTVTVSDGEDSTQTEFGWQVNEPDPPVIEEYGFYLPLMMHRFKIDEPNNSCAQAYNIAMAFNFSFFHEDQYDWYSVVIPATQTVQVRLTNFGAPGQIVVYGGTCANLLFLQNNGNFLPTKIINLPNLAAGTYYIRVITDGNYSEETPYNLIVDGS